MADTEEAVRKLRAASHFLKMGMVQTGAQHVRDAIALLEGHTLATSTYLNRKPRSHAEAMAAFVKQTESK